MKKGAPPATGSGGLRDNIQEQTTAESCENQPAPRRPLRPTKNLPPTSAVEQITALNLTGNLIPLRWFQELRTGVKRDVPAHAAIHVLADVVYWYRAVEVREEASGRPVGLRRKFNADRLQVSYDRYERLLGYSRSVIKRAFDTLVDRGLLVREFRFVRTQRGTLANVMFIEPVADAIRRISTLPETEGSVEGVTLQPSTVGGGSVEDSTYTRDFEEISTRDSSTAAHQAAGCAALGVIPTIASPKTRRRRDSNWTTLHRSVMAAFLERTPDGRFESFPKEVAAVKRLVTEAAARRPQDPRGWIEEATETFMRLSAQGDRRFRGQPFRPSLVASAGLLAVVVDQMGQSSSVLSADWVKAIVGAQP